MCKQPPNPLPSRCVCIGKTLFYLVAVLAVGAGIFMYSKQDFDPIVYELSKPPVLTGTLKANNQLRNAQLILKGQISGPESLVVEGNTIYTGTWDGKLLKIVDGFIDKTLKIKPGKKTHACGSYHTEPKCGRPLGIRRFNDKEFIVAEAYSGLYTVNFETDEVKQIFSTEKPLNGKKIEFVNDLDVFTDNSNTVVFFSHSSTKWDRRRFLHDFFEGKPTGRVIRVDLAGKTPKATVALDGLAFANGVQLHPDGESLLVAECSRARIVRYYHCGAKKGARETFAKNLPGFPDNIRLSASGQTFLVGIASVRHSEQLFPFMDLLGAHPWIRWTIVQLVPERYLASLLAMIAQKYGLVLEFDLKGNIVRSFHDPTGAVVQGVSQASDDVNYLYLGSYHADFIAKVPKKSKANSNTKN